VFYNFIRIHQTLCVTPAMAAGASDKVWEIADIVRLVEERQQAEQAEKSRTAIQFAFADWSRAWA